MKNSAYIIILAAIVLLFQGCSQDYESVFQDSSDERVTKELQALKNELLDSENGWKGYIYTGTGPGFLFYFQFRDDGYVTVISDYNAETGSDVQTTTYAIKGLQQPTLSFDTYSYIHLLADPSGSVNGGEDGVGLISDFEFYLEGKGTDSLKLMGIKNEVPMILVKASASERDKFLDGEVGETVTVTDNYFEANPYPWIQVGNTKVAVELDSALKIVSFLYLDGSRNVVGSNALFLYSTDGLMLKNPVPLGNSLVDEIHWDANIGNFYVLVNGQKLFFQEGAEPVIPLAYALGFLHSYVVMDESIAGYTEILPPGFMDIYNQAKAGVLAIQPYQLELIAFILLFDTDDNVNMYYFVRNSTGTYRAGFSYRMNVSAATNKVTFTFVEADPNGEVVAPGLEPLLNYFENNTFVLNYYQDPEFGTLAGFYPDGAPGTNFYGFLE